MRSKTPDPRTITLEIALLEHLQFLKIYLKKIFFLILIFYCIDNQTTISLFGISSKCTLPCPLLS